PDRLVAHRSTGISGHHGAGGLHEERLGSRPRLSGYASRGPDSCSDASRRRFHRTSVRRAAVVSHRLGLRSSDPASQAATRIRSCSIEYARAQKWQHSITSWELVPLAEQECIMPSCARTWALAERTSTQAGSAISTLRQSSAAGMRSWRARREAGEKGQAGPAVHPMPVWHKPTANECKSRSSRITRHPYERSKDLRLDGHGQRSDCPFVKRDRRHLGGRLASRLDRSATHGRVGLPGADSIHRILPQLRANRYGCPAVVRAKRMPVPK